MPWPEPSINDHLAPWNMDMEEDENGELVWVCNCAGCQQKRREEAKQERLIDAYEDMKLMERL